MYLGTLSLQRSALPKTSFDMLEELLFPSICGFVGGGELTNPVKNILTVLKMMLHKGDSILYYEFECRWESSVTR